MLNRDDKEYIMRLIVLILIVMILCATGTYAWLAINNKVSEDGIEMNTEVTPNLVISNSATNVKNLDVDDAPFKVTRTFNSTHQYLPCTHYSTNTSSTHTTFDNLKYLTNTGDIDPSTGLASTYQYQNVDDENKKFFYVDYTTYIASAGVSMSNATITATLSGKYKSDASTDSTKNQQTFNAASIDFYVDNVFKGTLNVAGKDPLINDGTTAKTSLDILSNGTIPESKSGYITVTLRCYFDGALLMNATEAYVNSTDVVADYAVLNILFSATEN